MKLIYSEYPADYSKYRFPYQVWGIEESVNDRDQLLAQGFLPSRMKIGLWYLARSSRVDLQKFTESSENRRIIKNTNDFEVQVQPIGEFKLTDDMLTMVERFSKKKMDGKLSAKAIKRIFSPHMSEFVMIWSLNGGVVGFVPIMKTLGAIYYWFAFYDDTNIESGLGLRMMLEAVKYAQLAKLKYAYLGTVYTNSALYKTNFNGFEYFNGFEWSTNKDELKYLIGKDQYKDNDELFKDDIYLNRFHDSSLNILLRNLTKGAKS